jgi:hypothetical protein
MELAMSRFIISNTSRIVHVANFAHCHNRIFLSNIKMELNHVSFDLIRWVNVNNAILKDASEVMAISVWNNVQSEKT